MIDCEEPEGKLWPVGELSPARIGEERAHCHGEERRFKIEA